MEAKTLPQSPDDISTFYIQATESIQERWPRTLKQGDSFALFDALGDCMEPGLTPAACSTTTPPSVGNPAPDRRPAPAAAVVLGGERQCRVHRRPVQPDIYQNGEIVLPREALHLRRSRFLWQGALHERIALRNFDVRPQTCWLSINFAADFADLFEIRGMKRAQRGFPP